MSSDKSQSPPVIVVRRNVKEYLKEATPHGFKYIADSRTLLERLAWITLIMTAFIYSSIFIYNSIQEAKDNPVASVVEVMDAASMSFPSVTVYHGRVGSGNNRGKQKGKQFSSYRLIATALNALEFGCRKSKTTEQDCLDRAEKTRHDFKPAVKGLIQALVDIWGAEASSGRHVLETDEMLEYLPDMFFFDAFCTLNQVWKEQGGPNLKDEEGFVDILTDTFERSGDSQERIIRDYLDDLALKLSQNVTVNDDCSAEKILASSLSGWVNAIFYHLYAYNREPDLPLGDLMEFTYISLYSIEMKYGYTVPSNLGGGLTDLPDKMLDSLCGDSCAFSPWELVDFTEFGKLGTFQSNFKEFNLGHACGKLFSMDDDKIVAYKECMRLNISKVDPSYLLKVLKYHYQPPNSNITSIGHLNDVKVALKLTDQSLVCNPDHMECRHSDPLMRYCYFGYSDPEIDDRYEQEDDCSFFTMTYGYNGLAYTFNGPDFWSLYANNTYNRAFYSEIYQRTEGNDDVLSDGGAHGKFLEFYIFPEASERYAGKAPSPSLAIHHPTTIPSLPVSLEPGFSYTFTVTPTVVTTDKDLLDIPENKRKCRFADEGHPHYADSVFNSYSQSSCLFECRLRQVYDTLGCLSWDYPHFEEPINICDEYSDRLNARFDNVIRNTSAKDCDCPADCDITSYSMVISKSQIDECFEGHSRDELTLNKYLKLVSIGPYENVVEKNECEIIGLNEVLTKVKVQMDMSAVTKTRRIRRTTITDQIASLGGLVGLFTGMSMLSVAEALVWLFRTLNSVCKSNSKRTRSSREITPSE